MINQYVGLMFLSSSLSRRIVCCTTSNADCTSNVAKNSVDLVRFASAFASVMMRLDMIGYKPLVNPYCSSDIFVRFNFSRRQYSNNFPMTAVTVIPL